MHRGSQVYQIAEEIDFSVGGRIMTRARGVRVDGEYIAGQTEVGPPQMTLKKWYFLF